MFQQFLSVIVALCIHTKYCNTLYTYEQVTYCVTHDGSPCSETSW